MLEMSSEEMKLIMKNREGVLDRENQCTLLTTRQTSQLHIHGGNLGGIMLSFLQRMTR